MTFSCTLASESGGRWRAIHESREVGRVEALADSREAAVEKLKGEIRYRLELCPCTGESYQHIDVAVTVHPGHSATGSGVFFRGGEMVRAAEDATAAKKDSRPYAVALFS